MPIYNLYTWKDPSLKMTRPVTVALISKNARSMETFSSIFDSTCLLMGDLIDEIYHPVIRLLDSKGVDTVLELEIDLV